MIHMNICINSIPLLPATFLSFSDSREKMKRVKDECFGICIQNTGWGLAKMS